MPNASANITWRSEHGTYGNCNSNIQHVKFHPKNYWNRKCNSQEYGFGKIGAIKVFRKVFKGCGYFVC